jgi:hypothetical protein
MGVNRIHSLLLFQATNFKLGHYLLSALCIRFEPLREIIQQFGFAQSAESNTKGAKRTNPGCECLCVGVRLRPDLSPGLILRREQRLNPSCLLQPKR